MAGVKNAGGVSTLLVDEESPKNCGANIGCWGNAELLRLVRMLLRLSPPVPVDDEDPPLILDQSKPFSNQLIL